MGSCRSVYNFDFEPIALLDVISLEERGYLASLNVLFPRRLPGSRNRPSAG